MAKMKTEDLLKIEFNERKGTGRIVSAKPIKTQIGVMNFHVNYDVDDDDGDPLEDIIFIDLTLKDDFEGVYEDGEFFDGNHLLTNNHCYCLFLTDDKEELAKLLNASNPIYKVKSKLRKYPDVILEGPEMIDFFKSLQVLADLMMDQNAILTYVCQHDDSFEILYNAQKEAKMQKKQAEKQEEQKQQAAERRKRKARQEAEEKARQRMRIMIVIGLLLIIAGIYGLYKGYVISVASEQDVITGLLVMGISFFLIPIGFVIVSNNKH